MFSKILVPVDFSEHSTLTFRPARLIADAFQAEVELVHVVEQVVHAHPSFWSAEPGLADELHRQSLAAAEELVAGVLQAHGSELGQRVRTVVLSGSLAGGLADYAAAGGHDLIVMSTHGRTGFARWLMGSVCERLLRVAPCSALVVRAATAPHAVAVRRVLVAVDLSEPSRRALHVAAALAPALGASLEALHVCSIPFHADEGSARAGLAERLRETARGELDAFIEGAALPVGLELERTIVAGAPAHAIADRLVERQTDLLVLGTHGRGGVKRLVLGSVAEAMARYAPCATLVAR